MTRRARLHPERPYLDALPHTERHMAALHGASQTGPGTGGRQNGHSEAVRESLGAAGVIAVLVGQGDPDQPLECQARPCRPPLDLLGAESGVEQEHGAFRLHGKAVPSRSRAKRVERGHDTAPLS